LPTTLVSTPVPTRRSSDLIIEGFESGFDLRTHTLCAAHMGSMSHNTYVPSDDPESIDDVDIMGALVPPPEFVLGLRNWDHWVFKDRKSTRLNSSHEWISYA